MDSLVRLRRERLRQDTLGWMTSDERKFMTVSIPNRHVPLIAVKQSLESTERLPPDNRRRNGCRTDCGYEKK